MNSEDLNRSTRAGVHRRRSISARTSAQTHYVMSGPGRSLRKTAEALGKNVSLIERWSSKFDWNELAHKQDQKEQLEEERRLAAERAKTAQKRAQAVVELEDLRLEIARKTAQQAYKALGTPMAEVVEDRKGNRKARPINRGADHLNHILAVDRASRWVTEQAQTSPEPNTVSFVRRAEPGASGAEQ